MAKRRRTVTRSHTPDSSYRPGFSRGTSAPRRNMPPPSQRGSSRTAAILGALVIAGVVLVGAYWFFLGPGKSGSSPAPTARPTSTVNTAGVHPPAATPLASAPAEPSGDGTTATIETDLGTIKFELYTESAPVASENFINLANAGYYNGIGFHRVIPGFVIQGGDPEGTGGGGPGYTIEDEPVVGEYTRGIVAMARTSAPNSQGSQFFIVLDDSVKERLDKAGGYVIFGKVTEGMDVADAIAEGETTGPPNDAALEPVIMNTVTIQVPPTQ